MRKLRLNEAKPLVPLHTDNKQHSQNLNQSPSILRIYILRWCDHQQINLEGVKCFELGKNGVGGWVVKETGQEISLEKEQGKPEKISRLAIGIKATQGQPLPGSARDAPCYANARGESIARHSTPRSEGLGGPFSSSHLFLQQGCGSCLWNPASSCLPHSQVFSLKHTVPDSQGWDAEKADTRAKHLSSGYTSFLSPSCLKDGALQQVRDRKMKVFHILGNTSFWFSPFLVSPASLGRCFVKILMIY